MKWKKLFGNKSNIYFNIELIQIEFMNKKHNFLLRLYFQDSMTMFHDVWKFRNYLREA